MIHRRISRTALRRGGLVLLPIVVTLMLLPLVGAGPRRPATPLPQTAPVKTWIFFTDKGVHDERTLAAALTRLEDTYDTHAIERRRQRRTAPALFDTRDLPVPSAYVDAVTATGARVHVTSRWLGAVSAWVDAEQARAIAALPFVESMQPVRRWRRVEPPQPDARGGGGAADGGFYGLAEEQLTEINLIALHDTGATGAGVVVGILDTGFNRVHDAFNHPDHPLQVVAEYDFVDDDENAGIDPGDPESQHRHGTLILGTLGAYAPGELVGAAYDAAFILCKTEDTTDEYQGEEDNYVAGLEFIEQRGGDVATSSLGYIDWYTQEQLDGLTAVTTIAVNAATDNGVYCCTAAGNDGHDDDPETSHLLAPSDAFKVLACGAVESTGEIAGFSADGPTADGRVKPEVLARGVETHTVHPNSTDEYRTANGTSLSTPLVAGAVACIAQAQPTWTVDQLRSFLIVTASEYVAHGTHDPLYVYGYGIIDAYGAVALDCNGNGVPDPDDIEEGTSRDVNGNGIPDECECLGDVDANGVVDFADILAVLGVWGPCEGCPEDLNGDGVADFADILGILGTWGPCE